APGEVAALTRGELHGDALPLVRLHSECLTGDVLGSLRCDCGQQLSAALAMIAQASAGVLLYLPQEGRGIGLANKIRAYALQDKGLDTVDANLALGLPVDRREYASAAEILRFMGLRQVRLLTNNPSKSAALKRRGIQVVERVPLTVPPNAVDLPTLRGSFRFPIKYGYASVGRVVEVGSEVRTLAEGDAVFVHHPHQAAYVVPATAAVRLPSDLDPTLGVFLANLETATNVVLDAAPRLGERVAIFGQGAVGLLITQLTRRTGAGHVVAVDPIARRRELARGLGADEALASGDALDGANLDVAIEASGHVSALDQALRSVA